jgi:biopolymer transport protein ExbD
MMAMGSLSDSDDDFNPEINTTPLVDVMLVLLIIFMITIPVMQQNTKVALPRATSQPNSSTATSVRLAIDASGTMFWNDAAVDPAQLRARIADAARQSPQPELHLRAERTTPYEKVAQVMAAAQSGGLEKIGFITEPQPK